MKPIPIYKPSLCGNEKKYVTKCLNSSWISSKGTFISKFEKSFSKFLNVKYSLTTTSGTTALHIALLALDIGPNDEIIVPTLTYIASVNAIRYTKATPIFIDSFSDTWQMNYHEIARKITVKTKAILVVHLYGHPCDMNPIMKIAARHRLLVIEDCAEAIGSLYRTKHVGSFGNIATFSFYGNKTITTGEGGMIVTNNKRIYEKAHLLKNQGVSKTKEYWHPIIGYNYRMTNICAAIGLAQLENISSILEKKQNIAKLYKKLLKNLPIQVHKETNHVTNSYWMVSILLQSKKIRDKLRKTLAEKQIETRPIFHPIHTMPMYRQKLKNFPIAQNLSKRGINLPSWPNLTKKEIIYICNAIKKFFDAYAE